MADVLGDALQKLSVARAPLPPALPEPPAVEAQVSTAIAPPAETPVAPLAEIKAESCSPTCDAGKPVVHRPVPVMAASDVAPKPHLHAAPVENKLESSEHAPLLLSVNADQRVLLSETSTAVTLSEASSVPLASVETKTTSPRSTRWDRLMAGVSEYRRQLAAVVVIICMAGYWFEESRSSKSNSASSDTLTEDFADIEAALSEFDVQSGPAMREPAEPVDTSASPGFDLSIPSDNAFSAASEQSNPSETTATYPDEFGGLEIPANPNSTQQNSPTGTMQPSGFSAAPVSAPAGRNVKAKLSHSIQPIN